MRGNLLYNGDFETGTTEGWINGAYGLVGQLNFSVSAEAKLIGNYGGLLETTEDYKSSYIAYDKVCSFEEYEGYLFIMYGKIVSGLGMVGQLYGLDDKGNLKEYYNLGYNIETGVWRKFNAILRGLGDITHFSVGALVWGGSGGAKFYIDEVKLIPLKSIKGHILAEIRTFQNVTTITDWYAVIGCIGYCRIESVIETTNVSGTDPTLNTRIDIGMFGGNYSTITMWHSQIEGAEVNRNGLMLPEASFIKVRYIVEGTEPSFDITHYLRLIPYP